MRLPGQIHSCLLASIAFVLLFTVMCGTVFAAGIEDRQAAVRPWSVSLQTRYFFQSRTSYEFGNPFPPHQAPLSRLEFPLDSWWAGASMRREFSRFSAGVEFFRNLSDEARGVMMDSDWDDAAQPALKTIYSESSCRMEPSYRVRADADLKISDWIGLPGWLDLRPLAGLAWQRFTLVTHDGFQSEIGKGTELLPGDGIRFEQTYWQFFTGLKTTFELGKPFHLTRLAFTMQGDWAYVAGSNEDHHLLRTGNRITREKTTGDAWHALVNLKIGFTQNLSANIGAEYLRIKSTGSHNLTNNLFGIDFTFDHGVKVWSEQWSVSTGLEYRF